MPGNSNVSKSNPFDIDHHKWTYNIYTLHIHALYTCYFKFFVLTNTKKKSTHTHTNTNTHTVLRNFIIWNFKYIRSLSCSKISNFRNTVYWMRAIACRTMTIDRRYNQAYCKSRPLKQTPISRFNAFYLKRILSWRKQRAHHRNTQ